MTRPAMPYEPERHHRRSTRLPGYDYTHPAAYFVTLCTHERLCLFGAVREGTMHLNEIGRVVDAAWRDTERRRAGVALDAYVIMPNHLHGILLLLPPDADPNEDPTDPHGYHLQGNPIPPRSLPNPHENPATAGGNPHAPRGNPHNPRGLPVNRRDMARHVPTPGRAFGRPVAGSLSTIIGAFKSAASRRINVLRGTPGAPVWQGRFHDRILRTKREWHAARRYIEENPARWDEDKNNPMNHE